VWFFKKKKKGIGNKNVFGILVEIERCEIKPPFEEMETEFKKRRYKVDEKLKFTEIIPFLSAFPFFLCVRLVCSEWGREGKGRKVHQMRRAS
jgi:hypothetical protein